MDLLHLGRPGLFVGLLALTGLIVWGLRTAGGQGLRRRDLPRLAVLALLALAASGLELRSPRPGGSTVFLLDRSASVSRSQWEAAIASARRLAAGDKERYATVVFGGEALVESALGDAPPPELPRSTPDPNATDLAEAIRVGLSVAGGPVSGDGPSPRLVLLSDGRSTRGDPRAAAAAAAARGVPIHVVSLDALGSRPGGPGIARVEAPAGVRRDEPFAVEVELAAEPPEAAEVVLAVDGRVRLRVPAPPSGPVVVDLELDEPGLHVVTAVLEGPGVDPRPGLPPGAVVACAGRPRVLRLGARVAADGLDRALRSAGLEVVSGSPATAPATADELAAWDAVILDGVAPSELGARRTEALARHVTDRGGGLVVVGEATFAPPGWEATPLGATLPLTGGVQGGEATPRIAVTVLLDVSGSMAEGGGRERKLDSARAAILRLADHLRDDDLLSVVSFSGQLVEVVPAGPLPEPAELRRRLGELTAGGPTRMVPALRYAVTRLRALPADRRVLLVVSDGRTVDDPLAAAGTLFAGGPDDALAADALPRVSAMGTGTDSDRHLLSELARIGGGRLYLPERIEELPAIFDREARRIRGPGRVVETTPVRTGPGAARLGLRDDEDLPRIGSYAATRARRLDAVALATENGEPLVAAWRFGLGRTVAWAQDLGSPANRELVAWAGWPGLVVGAVRWAIRDLGSGALVPRWTTRGETATLEVEALEPDGRRRHGLDLVATVSLPSGDPLDRPLAEAAPGFYRVELPTPEAGLYGVLVRATGADDPAGAAASDDRVLTGIYLAAAPEQRDDVGSDELLAGLARATAGSLLGPFDPLPRRARSERRVPLAPWLAALALVLFLLDLALLRPGATGQIPNRRILARRVARVIPSRRAERS